VSDSEACRDRTVPVACPIENGRHRVRLEARDPYLSYVLDVVVDGGTVRRELRFGVVEAKEGYQLDSPRGPIRALALIEGHHEVTVIDAAGAKAATPVEVRAGAPLAVP
jgi:hypothetical protein